MVTAVTDPMPHARTRQPPTPPGLPVLGHSGALLRDPLAFLRRCHEAHGPVFRIRAPGRNMVVLAGRDANQFVARAGRRALVSGPFWGRMAKHHGSHNMILAVDGEPHKAQRRLYGQVLSKRTIEKHREGCDALARDTFLPPRAAPRELLRVVDRCRLVIARMVHHTVSDGAPPVPEATARAMMETFRWESNALLLSKWPRVALKLPRYARYERTTRAFLNALITNELRPGHRATDWFGKIALGRERHPEWFTEPDLYTASLLPFVAGVDTVGATLGFVLMELHRDPGLLRTVRAEVAAAYEDGVPTPNRLAEAETLQGVVFECLRRYPAAFGLYRTAAEDFTFEGVTVRAGTHVMVFTTATHFEAKHFPNPERLDVGRAARGEYQPHVFMPYGAGPHVCLGAGMGEAMLMLAAAAIVQHHHLESTTRQAPRYVFDPSLTLHPRARLRISTEQQRRAGKGLLS